MESCQAKNTKTLNVYIDGFNLYHSLDKLNDNSLKWLDHLKLARTFLRQNEKIGTVYFFTAVVTWDKAKSQRHVIYLKALRGVGVIVVESNFKKQKRHCFERKQFCKFREEKKTDVSIGITMLVDGYHRRCGRALLITADSDQIPTIKALRQECPELEITLAFPPGENREATEIGGLFQKRNRVEIKSTRIRRCLFPRDVYDQAGKKVATRPASYA